jgi:CBS domain-containing protein
MASIKDVMTSRVVTVRSDEPVSAAVERLLQYGFSALPVVSASSRLVGMVSLLDVLRYREVHAEEGREADERVRVAEIMTQEVLSLPATAGTNVVAQRLRSHGELRVLPVVQGGRLVGVVTRGDLLRHRRPGERPGGMRHWLGRPPRRSGDRHHDPLPLMARARRTGPPPPGTTPVHEVMTREVVTAHAQDPLRVAAELMLHHRHTALPVVDGGGVVVGVVSEADILADPHAGRAGGGTVAAVMTRAAITVGPDATLAQARSLVADRGLRVVPVVDGAGVLVGVLSRSDLV